MGGSRGQSNDKDEGIGVFCPHRILLALCSAASLLTHTLATPRRGLMMPFTHPRLQLDETAGRETKRGWISRRNNAHKPSQARPACSRAVAKVITCNYRFQAL